MRLIILLAYIVFLTWPVQGNAAGILPQRYTAEVIEVKDGDTIKVSVNIWLDQIITANIRIKDIDTPELRSSCPYEREQAIAAKQRLQEIIGNETVILQNVEYGKYAGRVLADVYLISGESIAEILIGQNLARSYNGKKRSGWC